MAGKRSQYHIIYHKYIIYHMISGQVGAISKMPGLQSFCVGTAVGLAAIFLIQARMIIIIIVIIMIIVNMI